MYSSDNILLNLLQVFYEIDLNGDGVMKWSDFTNYLIDVGKTDKVGGLLTYKRNPFKDSNRWTHCLGNVKYSPENSRFALWQKGSNIVETFNSQYKPVKEYGKKFETGVEVVDAVYIPSINNYCISYSNMMMRFYDDNTGTLSYTTTAKCCQHAMEAIVDQDENLLYTGGVNGIIYEWNLSKDLKVANHKLSNELGGLDSKGNIKPGSHTDMILCLKNLDGTHLIASGSMDHSIHLWDINCHKFNMALNGHSQAVSGLDYSTDYKLLLSSGYDNQAIVWNPYVDKPIHILQGHVQYLYLKL